MGVDMVSSAINRGAVGAIRRRFEDLAVMETEQTLRATCKSPQRGGAEQWLEIYRAKRLQSEEGRLDTCQVSDVTPVTDKCQSWLDIYREKRRQASDDKKRLSRKTSFKKSKASKKELEQRILSLMQRYNTLEDLLELALTEGKSGNESCPVWLPKDKEQTHTTTRHQQRCVHRAK